MRRSQTWMAAWGVLVLSGCGDELREPPSSAHPDPVVASAEGATAPGEGATAPGEGATAPAEGAAAPAEPLTPPVARSVRVISLVHEELLGSEARALAQLVQVLEADRRTVDASAASEQDQRAMAAYFDGAPPTSLPTSLRAFEVVLVSRFAPPRVLRNGGRVSSGVAGVVVLHPPVLEPVFEARGDDAAGFPLDGNAFGRWVLDLMSAQPREEAQ